MTVRRFTKKTSKFPQGNSGEANDTKELQDFIRNQIYMIGNTFNVNAGGNPNNKITLSGSNRRLFGLTIFVSNANLADDDTFTLNINNENVITTCNWKAFYPAAGGNYKPQMFFPLPRPLFGSDAINISWNAMNNKTVYATFYVCDSEGKE